MDFGTNKTPVEVIKEGEFGVTYFRDIYSCVTVKRYKQSSSYYDVSVNKYGVKCETSQGFWENKAWINKQILMINFIGI